MSNDQARIVEVLMQAERLREAGKAVDLESLCQGDPDLLPKVRKFMELLARDFCRNNLFNTPK